MWVLIVGEIIINVGLSSHLFRGRGPSGKPRSDRTVMHPDLHVPALPGVVTTQSLLQATRRVELIFVGRCPKGNIVFFELGILLLEVFNLLTSYGFRMPIPAKHPVVLRPFGEEDGSIAEVGWPDSRDLLPVLPDGRLIEGEGLRSLFCFELPELGLEVTSFFL